MSMRVSVYKFTILVMITNIVIVVLGAENLVENGGLWPFIITIAICGIALLLLNNPWAYCRHIIAIWATILVMFPLTEFGKDVREFKKMHNYSISKMYHKYLKAYDKITDYKAFTASVDAYLED